MATSKHVDTHSEDICSCPICLEPVTSPKSLPCLHTFCEKCIGEFIVTIAQKQEAKISCYNCPVCKTTITPTNLDESVSKWASLLPDNFIMSSIISKTCENKKQSKIQCDLCTRRQKYTTGSFWCRDCNKALCDNCKEVHNLIEALANHRVSSLENTVVNKYGVDVTAISVTCPVHIAKLLEAYCLDHKQLCCLACVTESHGKCNSVKPIEDNKDMILNSDHDLANLKTVLPALQKTIENLILQRNKTMKSLDDSAKRSQAKASKVVASAKDKLDRLLISFTKELSLLQENEKFAIDEELGRLNQLSKDVCHLVNVFNVVCDEGTTIQQFIHSERTKTRIENDILSVLNALITNNGRISIHPQINTYLQNIDSMTDIGKLQVLKSLEKDSEEIVTAKKNFETLLRCLQLKEILKTTFKKILTFPGRTFTGGLSFSKQMIICGDQKKAQTIAIDIVSGLETYSLHRHYNKRLTFDDRTGNIYVTFKDGYFEQITFERGFKQINNFQNRGKQHLDALAVYEDDLYIIVGNEIRKFKIGTSVKSVSQMTLCFNVNTECSNEKLNGLAIDSKRKHMFYTSKDNKVICTNLEGGEIFQFEDKEEMKKPISITVHSSGYILVGYESGSVHAVSPDGVQHFTLIEKCQNLTRLCDIWLDQSEETLFLCGNEFIEIYHIDVS